MRAMRVHASLVRTGHIRGKVHAHVHTSHTDREEARVHAGERAREGVRRDALELDEDVVRGVGVQQLVLAV